ncbi:HlyD family secretion protein [Corallincola spongiicola]|uniref:HlyD family secretion protein n=1 Tax=Corallincola spongiicola TaxID=2520508 RepID=A0ABY1WU98_9GAMM|nr:efflux RND transporter periplasmic adaptor subunit [Corallincola spongiicola]TAA48151.1 HlyD family secretion protein [Corallincola spongiicola]
MRQFKIIAIITALLLIVCWLGYRFYLAYQPQPMRLQGQIEARQYSVSSKVPGRIGELLVKKGDSVTVGQAIFTINSPELAAKLSQAKAGNEAASALADEALNGARRQAIAAAKDQWLMAKAAAELFEKTYQRIDNLYQDGVLAEQKRDEVYTEWQAAKYTESTARQLYEMAQEGARKETQRAAQANARMTAGIVAEVEAYVADTQVNSRHSGEISAILLRPGELAPQGFPVVTLIDMSDAWAVFNVREDRLKHFNKDSEFEAVIPALGEQSITFKVHHVAVMGDFATWRSTDSSQGFDMRTFEVEARPVKPIPGLRAGMSVLASY